MKRRRLEEEQSIDENNKKFETVFQVFMDCVRLLIEQINSRTWNISIILNRRLSNRFDNVIFGVIASNLNFPIVDIQKLTMSIDQFCNYEILIVTTKCLGTTVR